MINKKRGIRYINNRKGLTHEIFFYVFGLVLAAIVALALFNFAKEVVEQTIFEKNYLARDIAILVNTLYAAPGDILYTYGEDIDGFILDFNGNRISVYEKREETKEAKIFYLFAKKAGITFSDIRLNENGMTDKVGFFKSDTVVKANDIDILKDEIASP